jgi:hypothetical protein
MKDSTLFNEGQVIETKNYLQNDAASFDKWKSSPFLALNIYYEISMCYGYGLIQDVFKTYLTKDMDPSDDQEKINTWLYMLSFHSKNNLKPIFDYWKIPVSSSMANNVSQWQCSLPDDVYTQYNPSRASDIRAKYGNNCATSCSPKSFQITEPLKPILMNDVEQLN